MNGTTTVHTPPMSVHPRLVNAPKKRKQSGFSSDPEESIRPRKYMPHINVHVHNGRIKTSRVVNNSSSSSPPPPQMREIQSSPPFDPGCDGASALVSKSYSLTEYIAWHVLKAPDDTEAFTDALEILNRESCKYNLVKKFTAETWKTLGIAIGIGMALVDEVDDFEKYMQSKGKYASYLS